MKLKIALAIGLGFSLSSSICMVAHAQSDGGTTATTTTTSTSTSSGTPAAGGTSTSINANLQGAKSSNTTGMIVNVAGAGLHSVDAYTNFAAFYASCSLGCSNYPALARGIAQAALAIASISQMGQHGQSNQAIIPNICNTASGTCSPGQFNWPDFNSCGGNTNCYQTQLTNSTNPDLNTIFGGPNGGGPGVPIAGSTTTSSAFSSYNNALSKLSEAGVQYNPATGVMTYQDKSFKPADMKSPADLQKVLGLSNEDMAYLNKSNAEINATTAKLANDARVKAASDGTLQAAAAAAAAAAGGGDSALAGGGPNGLGSGGPGGIGSNGKGKGAGGGLDGGLGSGNGSGAGGVGLDTVGGGIGAAGVGNLWGDENDPNGAGKNSKMSKALKERFGRVPAGVAGKKRNFNGEQIGVSGDSIFDMMTRRYQVKVLQNTFLDPALVDPK